MADQRLEASPIAGGGDDGVGLKARAVGEDDIRSLEALDGGDDFDLPPLYSPDEAVVHGGPDAPLANAGDEAHRGTWEPVRREVAERESLTHGGDAIPDRSRQVVRYDRRGVDRYPKPAAADDVGRRPHRDPHSPAVARAQEVGELRHADARVEHAAVA